MASRKKEIELLKREVLGSNVAHNPKVYLSKRQTKEPSVSTWGMTISPPNDFNAGEGASVAFVDNMPGANYEHPVQYVFINDKDEVVAVVDATTPPDDLSEAFNEVDV